jgi:hypothetical protein
MFIIMVLFLEYEMSSDDSSSDDQANHGFKSNEIHPKTETRLSTLEEENNRLKEELKALKTVVSDGDSLDKLSNQQENEEESFSTDNGLPRRGVITGLTGLGVLGMAGTVEANSNTTSSGTNLEFGQSYGGTPSSGHGLKLEESSSTGSSFGLRAESASEDGQGVLGLATANSGRPYGINGYTTANRGVGVRGKAAAGSGQTFGVLGIAESPDGKALQGTNFATEGNAIGLEGRTDSPEGYGVRGRAKSGSGVNYGVAGFTDSGSGWGLFTPDDAKIGGTVEVLGNIEVSGIKNFVQTVPSDAGPKQVKYTSVEAGEPQTEHSDVVEMEDGVAIIKLPDHFGMVTSNDERLAVQVTPYCDEPVRPQVTDRSTDRIVVKDFGDGPDKYSFAYTIKGVRQGFEDQQVVSDSS